MQVDPASKYKFLYETKEEDFPGGSVVKNHLPRGTRVPSLVRESLNMPRSNKSCAPQLLSLCSGAQKPQLLSPRATITEAQVP